jgi:hypothetical protein
MDSQTNPNQTGNPQNPSQVVSGFQKRIIGDSVLIRQGIAQSVEANTLTIRQGGVGISHAGQVDLNSGGSLWSTSEVMNLSNSSSAVLVSKGTSTIDQSAVQVLAAAGSVSMDQSAVGVMAARDVSIENSAVVFLIAKNVQGNVIPLFGPREAAVFGAVAGLVGSVLFFIAKFIGRKRK